VHVTPDFSTDPQMLVQKGNQQGRKKRRDDVEDLLISYARPEAGFSPYSY
jgi:hypothetical protein